MNACRAMHQERGALAQEPSQLGEDRSKRLCDLRIGWPAVGERAPGPGEPRRPNGFADFVGTFAFRQQRDHVRYTHVSQATDVAAFRAVAQCEPACSDDDELQLTRHIASWIAPCPRRPGPA